MCKPRSESGFSLLKGLKSACFSLYWHILILEMFKRLVGTSRIAELGEELRAKQEDFEKETQRSRKELAEKEEE